VSTCEHEFLPHAGRRLATQRSQRRDDLRSRTPTIMCDGLCPTAHSAAIESRQDVASRIPAIHDTDCRLPIHRV